MHVLKVNFLWASFIAAAISAAIGLALYFWLPMQQGDELSGLSHIVIAMPITAILSAAISFKIAKDRDLLAVLFSWLMQPIIFLGVLYLIFSVGILLSGK